MGYDTMKKKEEDEKESDHVEDSWNTLGEITRGFTVDDTFDLFHNKIRMMTIALNQQQATSPVVLKMDEVVLQAIEQRSNAQFEEEMVNSMDLFARSFGQTVYSAHYKQNHKSDKGEGTPP